MKTTRFCFAALAACLMFVGQASADIITSNAAPVSYTHLTLPTILLV